LIHDFRTAAGSWEEIVKPPMQTGGDQFLTGGSGGDRVTISYLRHRESGEVAARVTFGAGCEGPPGRTHGGSISAVLDEVMGFAAWLAGLPVVTARLSVAFRRPVPLGSTLTARTELVKVTRRAVTMKISLIGIDECEVYATGEGRYFVVDPADLGVPTEVLEDFYRVHPEVNRPIRRGAASITVNKQV
jgi:uncharacterized protein (TIGR00369 family)